jgi:hypothetical protein
VRVIVFTPNGDIRHTGIRVRAVIFAYLSNSNKNSVTMKKLAFATAGFFAPLAVFAHEGHGHFDGNSLLHYFGTLEHGVPLGAMLCLVAVLLYRWSKVIRAARVEAKS